MDADLILVGGGLANVLVAMALRRQRPQLRLLLLEAGPRLGGNHTWSFHDGDLSPAQRELVVPLVGWTWPSYEVRFPQRHRQLASGYASIDSARLHAVATQALGGSIRLATPVRALRPQEVVLDDGSVLRAGAVLDARGEPPVGALSIGWQKFVGQVVRLREPHGLAGPILMDATVAQQGGYRFMYTLPLSEDTVLIEDTCYADEVALDDGALRQAIAAYAGAQGWVPLEVLREERGGLPIVLAGDPHALWNAADGVPRAGLAAGLFHPTTGYSLPEAVRLAERIVSLPDLRAPALFEAVRDHALARWEAQAFYRLLSRLLFLAAPPAQRWRMMQRFYGLRPPLIARFYAGASTGFDKVRILSGKPPVPVLAAVRAARWKPPARTQDE